MPIRRISATHTTVTYSVAKCHDDDHEPKAENLENLEPGLYQHYCPSCAGATVFSIDPRGRKG